MEKIDEVEKTREKERDQSTGICPGSRDAAAAGKCERIVGKYEDFCGYRAGGPEAVVYGSSTSSVALGSLSTQTDTVQNYEVRHKNNRCKRND